MIPTLHGRINDTLYLHGAKASQSLKKSASGIPLCISATLIDGNVAARSPMHSSKNYHSVVVYVAGCLLADPKEKVRALETITEHNLPVHWDYG